MAGKAEIPEGLQAVITQIDGPVTPAQIDAYGKWQDIQDQSYRLRTVLAAWRSQQTQDRNMRQRYANWLMLAMGFQVLAINVVFILMGLNVLAFETWTANTFIMSVFGEIAALVLVVVKYLFARPDDTLLKLARGRDGDINEHRLSEMPVRPLGRNH
jgi:hypothetical protein